VTTGFSDFHDDLRAVARSVLARSNPIGAGGDPPGPIDLRVMAESGWLGLEVAGAHGGAGATFAEVAVVLHELGRVVADSPYLGSAVLGAGLLNRLRPGGQVDETLEALAAGRRQIAVAGPSGDDAAVHATGRFRLNRAGGGLRVDGSAAFVPGAAEADRVLLMATDADGSPVVVAVEPGQVEVSAQAVVDGTRRLGGLRADDVPVGEEAVWRYAGDPGRCQQEVLDRAALAVACDSLGLAEAVMEATVAYVGVRRQFGRPIGSFQAVKHACADMLVKLTAGGELVRVAVAEVSDGAADSWVAVARAKSYVGGAAVDIAGQAMQLHGGIGYTWESGIHLFLKRATLNRALYGSPAAHRRRLGARYR
jgi:alkylation response protein AidB-like acyl-CoA dehydrogenase